MVSARDLSQRYSAYLFSQQIGEATEAIDFGLWLDAHWTDVPGLPDEPCLDDMDGEAHSGSAAVFWIEHSGEILGLLAGRNLGCYRIPRDATPPAVAIFLDDAPGCSTGSVHRERAFSQNCDEILRLPDTIPVITITARPRPDSATAPAQPASAAQEAPLGTLTG